MIDYRELSPEELTEAILTLGDGWDEGMQPYVRELYQHILGHGAELVKTPTIWKYGWKDGNVYGTGYYITDLFLYRYAMCPKIIAHDKEVGIKC